MQVRKKERRSGGMSSGGVGSSAPDDFLSYLRGFQTRTEELKRRSSKDLGVEPGAFPPDELNEKIDGNVVRVTRLAIHVVVERFEIFAPKVAEEIP